MLSASLNKTFPFLSIGEVRLIADTFRTTIAISKYVYMIVESQLAAFRFLKYQGQVAAKTVFNVLK